jgi:hypothetical protein
MVASRYSFVLLSPVIGKLRNTAGYSHPRQFPSRPIVAIGLQGGNVIERSGFDAYVLANLVKNASPTFGAESAYFGSPTIAFYLERLQCAARQLERCAGGGEAHTKGAAGLTLTFLTMAYGQRTWFAVEFVSYEPALASALHPALVLKRP